MTWVVETLDSRVDRELNKLPKEVYARFLRIAEMLEDLGPENVGLPHVKSLGAGLWEMRMSGKDTIGRSIYVKASEQRLVVVHAFEKKSRKTPLRALDKARERAKEVT